MLGKKYKKLLDEIIEISHEISDFLSNLKNKNNPCLL